MRDVAVEQPGGFVVGAGGVVGGAESAVGVDVSLRRGEG